MLIASARLTAETRLKRYLITQTIDFYLDGFSGDIKLPPFQSVTSITYTDSDGATQTLATDQYVAEMSKITLAYGESWPETRQQNNAVKIRLVVGYGNASAVPACIKNWMLIRIKQAYDQRDAVNVGNIVTEFPYSYVDGLLDPEIVWGR